MISKQLLKTVKMVNQNGFVTKIMYFTSLLQKNEHLTDTEKCITDYIYNITILFGNKIGNKLLLLFKDDYVQGLVENFDLVLRGE